MPEAKECFYFPHIQLCVGEKTPILSKKRSWKSSKWTVFLDLNFYLYINTNSTEVGGGEVSYFKRFRPISNKDSSVPVLTGGSRSLEAEVAQAM